MSGLESSEAGRVLGAFLPTFEGSGPQKRSAGQGGSRGRNQLLGTESLDLYAKAIPRTVRFRLLTAPNAPVASWPFLYPHIYEARTF